MQPLSMTDFVNSSEGVTEPFLTQIYPEIADAISPALNLAAILYWALLGYKIYAGYSALDVRDLLAKTAMTVAVFGTLHWAGFARQIYHLFLSLMEWTATTITVGDAPLKLLDALFRHAEQISQTLMNNNLYQINAIIEGTLILVINCLLFTITLVYLSIARFGLAVTMLLLPIFVGFALFRETRPWFRNWVSNMLNFSFIYILVHAILKLTITALRQYVDDIGEAASHFDANLISGDMVAQLVIVELVLIGFISQARGWAASLAVSATTQGSSAFLMLATTTRSAAVREK